MIISYELKRESKLKKTPQNFRQILTLINLTATGRRLVAALESFQKNSGRPIDFKPYPYEIITQLRAVNGDARPVGASFVTNGTSGCIYFAIQNELGVLAIQIVHEMAHALDESLWQLGLSERTEQVDIKNAILAESERNAFTTQKEFLKELNCLDAKYLSDLKKRFPHSNELFAEEIVN